MQEVDGIRIPIEERTGSFYIRTLSARHIGYCMLQKINPPPLLIPHHYPIVGKPLFDAVM
jgi:hypothetical protein